jgi:hypothetical protein
MRTLKFDEVKVVVNCQYFENYAWMSGGEAWKPKGGVDFAFIINSDEWCYVGNVVKAVVERFIAGKNNSHGRYEVVGYETICEEPKDITDEVATLCKAEFDRIDEDILSEQI